MIFPTVNCFYLSRI